MAPLGKGMTFKAGMRFTRTVKGVQHTLEIVKVGKELRFRDGQGQEFTSFGASAKSASGWASCNPYYFWRLENGAKPARRRTTRAGKPGGAEKPSTTSLGGKAKADETPSKDAP